MEIKSNVKNIRIEAAWHKSRRDFSQIAAGFLRWHIDVWIGQGSVLYEKSSIGINKDDHLFCGLGYMRIGYPDTGYRKCGNLEILGRTDPAFVRYCDHTYFLAGRSEKDTITSDREACL